MNRSIFIAEHTASSFGLRWPILLLLSLLSLGFIGAGCKRGDKGDSAPSAQIDGDKIAFATNAPQLGYLTVEPAQERHAVAVGLSGRLTWDDDVTVRVFSPVAGRVVSVDAEINMPVKKGDVLTSLNSPDFGQAQSDKEKAASDLALADRNVTRLRELYANDAAAKKD